MHKTIDKFTHKMLRIAGRTAVAKNKKLSVVFKRPRDFLYNPQEQLFIIFEKMEFDLDTFVKKILYSLDNFGAIDIHDRIYTLFFLVVNCKNLMISHLQRRKRDGKRECHYR